MLFQNSDFLPLGFQEGNMIYSLFILMHEIGYGQCAIIKPTNTSTAKHEYSLQVGAKGPKTPNSVSVHMKLYCQNSLLLT